MPRLSSLSPRVLVLALFVMSPLAFAQAGPANPMDQGKPGTAANQGTGRSNDNAVDPHPPRRLEARRAARAARAASAASAAAAKKR